MRLRATGSTGALGANYNEDLASVDFRELAVADTAWLRGFVFMHELDEGAAAEVLSVRTIVEAHARGFSTALSLKFAYAGHALPQPGSAEMTAEYARLDKVLPLLVGTIDILVIGNEPFLETAPQDRDAAVNVFYEAIARYVIAYRRERFGTHCPTSLYMGALNRLDLPERRTPAVERWMAFVRDTPEIAGTDIHPHVPDLDATSTFLDYVVARMRPEQTFLATEFSLVWHWKEHMSDPAPAGFLHRPELSDGSPVWQVIRSAIANPFTEEQWSEFLSRNAWLQCQRGFLREQMTMFDETGRLGMASYGFRQAHSMVTDFGPDKVPWLLNSVFAAHTVQPRADGTAGRGYPWFEEFRALQQPATPGRC